MKVPKKVTLEKAAANLRNAQRSTGAKSERGKSFSSRNGITHGIFTRAMLLPGENRKEFDRLWNETVSGYCPVGSSELHRAENLVWHKWRKRRLRLAETGVVAKLQADHDTQSEIAASNHVPHFNRAVTALKRLKAIEEEITSTGCVCTENLDWLRKLPYGDELKNFIYAIERVQTARSKDSAHAAAEMPPETETRGSVRDNDGATLEAEWDFARAWLLEVLDSLKMFIENERLYHGQHMIRGEEAQRNTLLVPPEVELNRFIRYENHLSSKYDQEELALERMQRLRKGEKIPPPTPRIN